MTLALQELSIESYSERVLPLTEPLWARGRTLKEYVAHTAQLAQTAYGRKHYRTFALADGGAAPLASFKRYERQARSGLEQLRAIGIGAVFTPEEHRGHGYASAMLGLALDEARREGFDFAYLFSDIHPQFYKDLGFIELPSRSISLRADALQDGRVAMDAVSERDFTAIRKCFDAMESRRDWGLTRSPIVWDWIRAQLQISAQREKGQPVHLVMRKGRTIVGYVFGRRESLHDAYVLDEFGFANEEAREAIPGLLRAAAGDLRRIVGWLPPIGARGILPRGSVRRRNDAIWMIAPLTAGGARFLERAKRSRFADGMWSLDHV
jgi:GNAT superfamily N-acetyltransferase